MIAGGKTICTPTFAPIFPPAHKYKPASKP